MRRLLIIAVTLLAGCGAETGKAALDGRTKDGAARDARVNRDLAPEEDLIAEEDQRGAADRGTPDAGADRSAADAAEDLAVGADLGVDAAGGDAAGGDAAGGDAAVLPSAKCSAPLGLTLSAGTLTVQGDTTGQLDEFAVDCSGDLSFTMDGPQLYYKVQLLGGKSYKITVTPTQFDVAAYAFPATTACTFADVDAGCKNPPNDRAARHSADEAGSGQPELLRIEPSADEDWIIVVDSYDGNQYGAFALQISEFVPPTNGSCGAPKAVALSASPVTVTGDTADVTNEFDADLSCGTSYSFDGPQLYYELALAPAVTYTLTLTPTTSWDPALYAFQDPTCTATTIDLTCTGHAADAGYAGDPETITLSSPTAATYVVAVDSSLATGGPFSLTISW